MVGETRQAQRSESTLGPIALQAQPTFIYQTFAFLKIYLVVPGLSCGTWDLAP